MFVSPHQPKIKSNLLTINHKKSIQISINQIVILQGFVNYTLIHLQDGQKKISARTLKNFENLLEDKGFVRVHKAFLVNPRYIVSRDEIKSELSLSGGLTAIISRRKKDCLKNIA
jgi:DNA-binding LytR/AlgR family response regulator